MEEILKKRWWQKKLFIFIIMIIFLLLFTGASVYIYQTNAGENVNIINNPISNVLKRIAITNETHDEVGAIESNGVIRFIKGIFNDLQANSINSTFTNASNEVYINGQPVSIWLYNQSDGSFNATYNLFAYNQTISGDNRFVKLNNPSAFNSYIFPNLDGSTGQVLSTLGDGILNWTSVTTSTGQTYFLYNHTSDISSYRLMNSNVSSVASKKNFLGINVVNNSIISNWITDTNNPNTNFIPTGVYTLVLNALINSTTNSPRLYAEIYQRTSDGTENLIGTTSTSNILSTSEATYIITGSINSFNLNTTDRIVIKLRLRSLSQSTKYRVTVFLEGGATGYFQMPTLTLGNLQIRNHPFQTNSTTIYNDTSGVRVGIGTASPNAKLTINDNSIASLNVSQLFVVNSQGKTVLLGKRNQSTSSGDVHNSTTLILQTGSWDTSSSSDVGRDWRIYAAGKSGFFGFPDLVFEQNNEPQIVVTRLTGTKVGIGTASPTTTLDVRGNVSLNSTLHVLQTGRVGIGTASPTSLLHIYNGSVNLTTRNSDSGLLTSGLGTFKNKIYSVCPSVTINTGTKVVNLYNFTFSETRNTFAINVTGSIPGISNSGSITLFISSTPTGSSELSGSNTFRLDKIDKCKMYTINDATFQRYCLATCPFCLLNTNYSINAYLESDNVNDITLSCSEGFVN